MKRLIHRQEASSKTEGQKCRELFFDSSWNNISKIQNIAEK